QSMYVTDANWRIIAADPLHHMDGRDVLGINLSGMPYYNDMMQAKGMVYLNVYYERKVMTGPAMIIGRALFDQKEKFLGHVFACVSTDKFHSILSRYNEEGQSLTVVNRAARLIADSLRPPDELHKIDTLTDQKDFEIASQSDSGTGSYSDSIGDVRSAASAALDNTYMVRYTTLPVMGWKIWERQSLRPLKAKLDGFYVNYLTVLVLALIVAFVFSKAVARLFTKPITQLQESASRLTAGNLSEPRPSRHLLTAEYDSLFRSFQEMSERLEAGWTRQQELLHEVSIAKVELEATFDAMTDAVIITDTEDRVLRANRAYYKLRGFEPEQVMGRELAEIGHTNDDWRLCETCIRRREGRHAIIVKTAADNATGRDLEIRVDPIYNLAGERVGAVQVLRDLTEMRLAEAEAEKVSALLRNLADSAYDAVYATDHDGRFLWANKRAADLFGFDSQKLEGEFFLQSIHEDDLERVRTGFERAARGDADRYEARYVTGDGSLRHVLITNSPVYADSKVVAVLGNVRDLTEERLEVEQVMRDDKLRALGQLASGVAHNFNNSLTAVLGYTQLVLGRVSDTKITRHLKTVETAALDAAKMVQRIQNFARQQQDEPSGPSDLNQIIRDALDLTRSRWRDDARATGIVYDIDFSPADELVAMCDQSAMREVFVNIIINALDAMMVGGRLTITTVTEGDKAIIKFVDTGCGMTEQVRQRIFEPFYTTKGAKGYGMGLAVTYGIVERHGGIIQVASQAGHGSTFTIKLPLGRTQQGEQVEMLPDISPREASILVVDDEASIRALLRDILRARGHKVLVAEDGLAGLKAIESRRFDMVITDLSMPGVDGWTIANEARRRWPETKLVIVTGYGGFAEMEVPGGDTSLIDALISKPFNIAQIDATISKVLLTVKQVA
ncbi:MAG TPA: PAS domain S-box protein, partial [Blastocatellia bacterium]|nr:PAS domain S-box protein [Blastocatellia bacterium]